MNTCAFTIRSVASQSECTAQDSGTGYLVATGKAGNRKPDRSRNGNGNLNKELHGQRWDD